MTDGAALATLVFGAVLLTGAAVFFLRARRRKSSEEPPITFRRGCGGPDVTD